MRARGRDWSQGHRARLHADSWRQAPGNVTPCLWVPECGEHWRSWVDEWRDFGEDQPQPVLTEAGMVPALPLISVASGRSLSSQSFSFPLYHGSGQRVHPVPPAGTQPGATVIIFWAWKLGKLGFCLLFFPKLSMSAWVLCARARVCVSGWGGMSNCPTQQPQLCP